MGSQSFQERGHQGFLEPARVDRVLETGPGIGLVQKVRELRLAFLEVGATPTRRFPGPVEGLVAREARLESLEDPGRQEVIDHDVGEGVVPAGSRPEGRLDPFPEGAFDDFVDGQHAASLRRRPGGSVRQIGASTVAT